jgi:cell division protein FtsQ
MNKFLIRWFLLGLSIILVIAALIFGRIKHKESLCEKAVVHFDVDSSRQFISQLGILEYMRQNKFKYEGVVIPNIDLTLAEEILLKQPFIRSVDCYMNLRNVLVINIEQRKPILRVYPKYGSPYYIDDQGGALPLSDLFSSDVIIASGNITPPMNTKLYTLATTVHQSTFWEHFIEHIFVEENGDLVFTTQISGHQVILGNTERLEGKLIKLESFYKKALVNIGWDQFKEINLEYKDQVICRK